MSAGKLSAAPDEDSGDVLVTWEDSVGPLGTLRLSPDKAVELAGELIHAAKVQKWRKSGILGG